MGLLMSCLMSYVGQVHQIFECEVFALGPLFPVAFGLLALTIGVGSFINARLVGRLGMRRLTHGAIVAAAVAAVLLAALSIGTDGRPSLWVFGPLLAVFNLCFSLAVPNCNALAMQPLGSIAGTASSLIGFYTTMTAALVGVLLGQAFDGTVAPLSIGILVLTLATLATVIVTERGRLFTPSPDAAPGRPH
jgi:DHA1 family bicyclomycin/chloramphenicol resistance-like MFS transporter